MNIIICSDKDAHDIGYFVEECARAAYEIADDIGRNIEMVEGDDLHEETIQNRIATFQDSNFIFLAFSHGTPFSVESLKYGPYVATTINQLIFPDAFFYTWSCLSFLELSSELIENGCKVFIGYETEIVTVTWGRNIEIFIECATYGLKLFFGGLPAREAFDEMITYYESMYRELLFEDPAAASSLLDHRTSLNFIGDELATIDDYIVDE